MDITVAIAWSVVVAFAGGIGCGWCVDHLGELGSLSLAACGALAGYVSRKLTRRGSKLAGACQVIAVCVAFFIAETCWLHWNTRNRDPSWWAAISAWPAFLREYSISAAVAAICTAYGAWSAYGYAAGRDVRSVEPATTVSPPS